MGRCTRNGKFIFGPSTWIRGLIKPPEGYGLAYVDYSSQEIGIAAALSGDPALMNAYRSGDPYMSFAVEAGLAPAGATKKEAPVIRERCKVAMLGANYGMGENSLAPNLDLELPFAKQILQAHKRTYRTFWTWIQGVKDVATTQGRFETVFGWPIHMTRDTKPRSLLNFPMQANGAEMLRLACCLATEAGLEVCAPIHDALLLAAPLDQLDDKVAELREHMEEAGRVTLSGFTIRTDATFVRYPDRYMDKRGEEMWKKIMELLDGKSEPYNPYVGVQICNIKASERRFKASDSIP